MPTTIPQQEAARATRHAPPWNVILLNDDDHTYPYVVEMLCALFGHTPQRALCLAQEVDATGRVIVDTTSRERAELKQEQIQSYGADHRLPASQGSMSADIEPCDG